MLDGLFVGAEPLRIATVPRHAEPRSQLAFGQLTQRKPLVDGGAAVRTLQRLVRPPAAALASIDVRVRRVRIFDSL